MKLYSFQDKNLQLLTFHWLDDDSGVQKYDFELYQLYYNPTSGLLEEPASPMITKMNWTTLEDFPVVTVNTTGMYSLRVKVYDVAGNVAQARANALVDLDSTISISQSSPPKLRIENANADSDYTWITTDPGTQINITWDGHFVNQVHKEKNLLAEVAPANLGANVKMLEDEWSNRSMDAIPNNQGITAFRYAHELGHGVNQIDSPRVWTSAPDTEGRTAITLATAMQEGHSVKVWVEAADFIDNKRTDSTVAHFDSSPPSVTRVSFLGDTNGGMYPFSSRCVHGIV